MSKLDTIKAAWNQLLAKGMSPGEAMREFDEEDLKSAMLQEMDEKGFECWAEGSLCNQISKAGREHADEKDMEQAIELWAAGWTSEIPECYRHNSKDFWRQCPTMSLFWRRPSRRPGKPGRKYLSTNQAFMAMKRGD